MSKGRPSIVHETLSRMDRLRVVGVSRHVLKAQAQAQAQQAGRSAWSSSTGLIHSDATAEAYRRHSLKYVKWARDTYGVRHLDALDERADELVSGYLTASLDAGHSPSTVRTEKAALRMFHGATLGDEARSLAAAVEVPERRRVDIKRSRGPVAMDAYLARDERYADLIGFLGGTGLRRREVAELQVGDVREDDLDGRAWVHVTNGKGGLERDVPVLAGHEADVLALVEGRDEGARVFERIPLRLDVHAIRREYAQALYLDLAEREDLPASYASGRLVPGSYDAGAVLEVSHALGHNRRDVVLRHYLR